MWRRVAHAVAEADPEPERTRHEKDYYNILENFNFVPGGRILAGMGTGSEVTMFNCYVIPNPEDSRMGIMRNLSDMVEIMARGGGVGVNMSSLRPKGAYIKTVNGHSSGPIAWMELYSEATVNVISQGGSRRGALMLMLEDWHPDLEEFIARKSDFVLDEATGYRRPKYLNGANISICISEEFMQAVKDDADWDLVYPDIDHSAYRTEWDGDLDKWKSKYYPVKVYKTVKAMDIWNKVCECAWKSADPGLVFMGRVRKLANSGYYESMRCVNPCGEQSLGPWAVCLLGSMNVSNYVIDDTFRHDKLYKDVKTAVRFLDNVIDLNHYFMDANEQAQKRDTRRMGIGTMGLADALIKLGIRYGSDNALSVTETIFQTIRDAAYIASVELSKERGPFGKYDDRYLDTPFIKALPKSIRDQIREHGIRNCYLLTNAPTGSTGLLSGASSGIEPVFAFAMKRIDRIGERIIYHDLYQEWKDDFEKEHQRAPLDNDVPSYFVKAEDLTPKEHVDMQAMAQKYIDSSVSKTTNMPNSATVDDVKELYMYAYDRGVKGITVYRDGSRDAVLHHIREEKSEAELIERPEFLEGQTSRITTPVGKVYTTINKGDDGRIYEVFVTVGKAGSDISADAEAVGRLMSIALRIPTAVSQDKILEEIVDQLSGIGGNGSTGFGPKKVRSLADGVAKVLNAYRNKENSVDAVETDKKEQGYVRGADICPSCGQASLVMSEGCSHCESCGFSKC